MIDPTLDTLSTAILSSPTTFPDLFTQHITNNSTLPEHTKIYFSSLLYHFAVEYNSLSAVKTLLQTNVNPSIIHPLQLYTPLARLLLAHPTQNTVEILNLLIQRGVSVNQIDPYLEQTPLSILLSLPTPYTQVHVDVLTVLLKNDAFCACPGDEHQFEEIPPQFQADLKTSKPQLFIPLSPTNRTVSSNNTDSESTNNNQQQSHNSPNNNIEEKNGGSPNILNTNFSTQQTASVIETRQSSVTPVTHFLPVTSFTISSSPPLNVISTPSSQSQPSFLSLNRNIDTLMASIPIQSGQAIFSTMTNITNMSKSMNNSKNDFFFSNRSQLVSTLS